MARVAQPARGPRTEWSWWPSEHFAPGRPLVQLPAGQQVMLRRAHDVLLAVATDLSPELLHRSVSDTIDHIALVVSDKPGAVQRIAESRGLVGSALVIQANVDATPAVAGVEFAARSAKSPPGGRLRFGIVPPPPLSAMHTGDLAVSDPVLLRVKTPGAVLPNDAAGALALMATSRTVASNRQLGVYWETYGFAPADTVEIAVWIERYTPQGIVRRFGIALRVATDLNTPVSMSWREPGVNRASVVAGTVPTFGRSVIVDTSKLIKGSYWLDIAVRKAGHEAVRGRTSFVVQ
jgi:hypothetical protein